MPLWCLVALYTISTPNTATAKVVNTNMMSMCRHGAAGSLRGLAPAPRLIGRHRFSGRLPAYTTRNGTENGIWGAPSILASAEGDAAEGLASEAVEDAAGHGGGDFATEPPILHEDRHGVGGGLGRGEGVEDGSVLLAHHLRRSGLAGHGEGGEAAERPER